MGNEYLYHCSGCQKPDTDYPEGKQIECEICEGVGKVRDGEGPLDWCTMCDGHGEYELRLSTITHHRWYRNDAYGIATGMYCDGCYNSNDSDKYPYKKNRYHDPTYCGEQLEPDE